MLTSCSERIYKSSSVDVIPLEITETTYADFMWNELTDEEAFTKNTVALIGKVMNVRPATINYTFMDTDVVDNITVFDVAVERLLYCFSENYSNKPVITVATGYNRSYYAPELPLINDGSTYLLFMRVASDKVDDPMHLSEFADCWVSNPKDLFCEKIGDYYLASNFLVGKPFVISLSRGTGLTEKLVDELQLIPADDVSAIKSFLYSSIGDSSKVDIDTLSSALSILRSRGANGYALWELIEHSCLLESSGFISYAIETSELIRGEGK